MTSSEVILNYDSSEYKLTISGYGTLPQIVKYTSAKIINITGEFISTQAGALISYRNLEHIYFPDTLETIENNFFQGTKIKTLFLPKSLKQLSYKHSFDYNSYLHDIYVDEDNQYFSSIDGVLYSKDKKVMFFYPPGKEDETFTIPESVESINYISAFDGCKFIKHIILPQTLTKIVGYLCYSTPNIIDVTVLRCPDNSSQIQIGSAWFVDFDSSNVKIYYHYFSFIYTFISNRLTISPCRSCNTLYCELNTTIFQNDLRIEEVILSEGITSICDRAFYGCKNLRILVVPNSLDKVGKDSFSMTGLTNAQRVFCPKNKINMLIEGGINRVAFGSLCKCTSGRSLSYYRFLFIMLFIC